MVPSTLRGESQKTEYNYVKEAGLGFAHAKFSGNTMIFDTQMVQKTTKTAYTNFWNAFLGTTKTFMAFL